MNSSLKQTELKSPWQGIGATLVQGRLINCFQTLTPNSRQIGDSAHSLALRNYVVNKKLLRPSAF